MSHEIEMQRMCVEAREREAEIERLTTLANANAQKCHDLAYALATEQRLAVHAEQKLAACQAALGDELTTVIIKSNNAHRPEGTHCCQHMACTARWLPPTQLPHHSPECPLSGGTAALDAALARAREEMRDAAMKAAHEAWGNSGLPRVVTDAIAALPTNGGRP